LIKKSPPILGGRVPKLISHVLEEKRMLVAFLIKKCAKSVPKHVSKFVQNETERRFWASWLNQQRRSVCKKEAQAW